MQATIIIRNGKIQAVFADSKNLDIKVVDYDKNPDDDTPVMAETEYQVY